MIEMPYRCDKCPQSFGGLELYEKHMFKHELQKQHVCLICMSSFSSSEGLKAHFKHHAEFLWEEDTEFPLECLAADPVEDEDPNTSQKNPIQRQQRLSESCDVLGTKYDFYALFLRTSLHILYKLF